MNLREAKVIFKIKYMSRCGFGMRQKQWDFVLLITVPEPRQPLWNREGEGECMLLVRMFTLT